MTRGRDQVFLLYEQERSEFLKVMGDVVVEREEPLLKAYEPCEPEPTPEEAPAAAVQPVAVAQPVAAVNRIQRPAQGLDLDESSETWFSEIEREALNKYFARYVYRDGLTFREWLRPRGLKMIQPRLFYGMHRCPPTVISGIIIKLEDKGIRLKDGNHR
jgi:hypothetical protein